MLMHSTRYLQWSSEIYYNLFYAVLYCWTSQKTASISINRWDDEVNWSESKGWKLSFYKNLKNSWNLLKYKEYHIERESAFTISPTTLSFSNNHHINERNFMETSTVPNKAHIITSNSIRENWRSTDS